MLHNRPIVIIIDDDSHDLNLFTDAIEYLNHPTDIILIESTDVIDLLRGLPTIPLIILSPISVSTTRKALLTDQNESFKYIPHVFYSASSDHIILKEISENTDGFFHRPENAEELAALLSTIINYWSNALTPLTVNYQSQVTQ